MSWWAGTSRNEFSERLKQETPRIITQKVPALFAPTEGASLEIHRKKSKERRKREQEDE